MLPPDLSPGTGWGGTTVQWRLGRKLAGCAEGGQNGLKYIIWQNCADRKSLFPTGKTAYPRNLRFLAVKGCDLILLADTNPRTLYQAGYQAILLLNHNPPLTLAYSFHTSELQTPTMWAPEMMLLQKQNPSSSVASSSLLTFD